MISGVVHDLEACILLIVRGPQSHEAQIEAIIDTGYTASLTLPPAQITALGLPWRGFGRGTLADGSECLFDVYEAEIVWDGRRQPLLIDEADSDPLLGMDLLTGHQLRIEVCPNGKVEITSLDP